MFQPKISVIISSYNYARFIGAAIESVLHQSLPAHEIIIIDDGSSDNSADVIKSYETQVRFIAQKNQGVCAVRNNGAKLATGNILAFLDSDDIWMPNKLEQQAAAFRADTEVGLVSCGIREFDNNGETLNEYTQGKSGWCAKDILLYKEPVLNTTASAIAIRRDIFEKVGGFDENRELFAAEDRELCYRVAKVSKLVFISEVLVDFRIHGDNGHLNIPQMERALFAAYKKMFNQSEVEEQEIRRKSFGNLHKLLAGCYFHSKNYPQFIKHLVQSLWLTPEHIFSYFDFPARWLKKKSS